MITFQDDWFQMIRDNTVNILGWIQLEKVRWLQNNNPEVPGLVYKLTSADEKIRKLENARKLWDAVMEITPIIDVFKGEPINTQEYDLDHFIPHSFVMNDELWNLMPMDSIWNSRKNNKLPKWDLFFSKFADNQFILYEKMHEKPGIHKLMKPVTETIYIPFGQIRNFIEKEIQERSSVRYWIKICILYTIRQEGKVTKFGILHEIY